jgi:hypothetical protein
VFQDAGQELDGDEQGEGWPSGVAVRGGELAHVAHTARSRGACVAFGQHAKAADLADVRAADAYYVHNRISEGAYWRRAVTRGVRLHLSARPMENA